MEFKIGNKNRSDDAEDIVTHKSKTVASFGE